MFADAEVAGYLSFDPTGFIGNAFVTFVVVAPSRRRHGIATALLADAEARLGPSKVFISTAEGNAAMRALLPRLGWIHSGAVAAVNRDGSAEVFFRKTV